MSAKRYEIRSSCPQCGCAFATVLTEDEIREKYGDEERFRMDCGECMAAYETERAEACPEWDEACRLRKS
jgi:hypothetical protein